MPLLPCITESGSHWKCVRAHAVGASEPDHLPPAGVGLDLRPITQATPHPFERIKCDDAAKCSALQWRQVAVFICTLCCCDHCPLCLLFAKTLRSQYYYPRFTNEESEADGLFKSLQRSARYITIITGSLTSIICLFKCLSSSISGYTLPRQSESLDCLSGLWGDSAPAVLCPRMLLPSPGQAQGP